MRNTTGHTLAEGRAPRIKQPTRRARSGPSEPRARPAPSRKS